MVMATPLQQQLRQRKLLYLGLIVALFTLSLLHRRFVVEAAADELQLREVSRGEVDLSSAAVRLTLTGSRGLAVTFLWSSACDMQERNEWNELDLLITSITRLQPHFITPWLFQSWNLSFNVAVEFDRPRDKYFYIGRGMQLLAQGERVHQGFREEDVARGKQMFPGNPDMRHHMGITYLRKIAGSDEKEIMQCLLDLSCIDPVQREARRFKRTGLRGEEPDLAKLAEFARNYPRLVRRLNDKLEYTSPLQVVNFLEENFDVPSRFKRAESGRESELKDWKEQFPVLPFPFSDEWPNPKSAILNTRDDESLDVFLMARAWFSYAQRDLPPPLFSRRAPGGLRNLEDDLDMDIFDLKFDRLKHRIPRYMSLYVFRSYPARTYAYMAENLSDEGWFDEEGWSLRHWFERQQASGEDLRVGGEARYHTRLAWERAQRAYEQYGRDNGLLLDPDQRRRLDDKAEKYRTKYKIAHVGIGQEPRREDMAEYGESYKAHMRLHANLYFRSITNFDDFVHQTKAESAPQTTLAHKLLFKARELYRTGADPEMALTLYEVAWPLWIDVLLQNPEYAQLSHVQEDLYEVEVRYLLRLLQPQRSAELQKILSGFAQTSVWPQLPLYERLPQAEKDRIARVRNAWGPLDGIQYYDRPGAAELKEALLLWSHLAGEPLRTTGGPPATIVSLMYPGQLSRQLTRSVHRGEPLPSGWRNLLDDMNIQLVRERLGLAPSSAPPVPEVPEGAPPPPVPRR